MKNVEWVYENDTLIYSEQTWLDLKKNEITDHERFYLFKNNLIAWFDTNNKLVDDKTSEFKELNNSLTSFAAKFIKK